MEKVIIFIGVLLLYGIIIFLLLKWSKDAHRKSMISVVNSMVVTGEISREEGDALIQIINGLLRKKNGRLFL